LHLNFLFYDEFNRWRRERDSSQAFVEESYEGQLSSTSDNDMYLDIIVRGRNKKGLVHIIYLYINFFDLNIKIFI